MDNIILEETLDDTLEEMAAETVDEILDETLEETIAETVEEKLITVYFQPQKDYTDLSETTFFSSPDVLLTLSENGYDVIDGQLTLPLDTANILMNNYLLNEIQQTNFMLQKCWFIGTTIQALMLISIFIPKLIHIARRVTLKSKKEDRKRGF